MDAIQISSSRRFCSVIVKQLPRLRWGTLYRGASFYLDLLLFHIWGKRNNHCFIICILISFFFTTFFYLEKKCRSLVFLKVENKHYTYFLEEEELKLMSHPRRLDVHLLLLFWKVTFFSSESCVFLHQSTLLIHFATITSKTWALNFSWGKNYIVKYWSTYLMFIVTLGEKKLREHYHKL